MYICIFGSHHNVHRYALSHSFGLYLLRMAPRWPGVWPWPSRPCLSGSSPWAGRTHGWLVCGPSLPFHLQGAHEWGKEWDSAEVSTAVTLNCYLSSTCEHWHLRRLNNVSVTDWWTPWKQCSLSVFQQCADQHTDFLHTVTESTGKRDRARLIDEWALMHWRGWQGAIITDDVIPLTMLH